MLNTILKFQTKRRLSACEIQTISAVFGGPAVNRVESVPNFSIIWARKMLKTILEILDQM